VKAWRCGLASAGVWRAAVFGPSIASALTIEKPGGDAAHERQVPQRMIGLFRSKGKDPGQGSEAAKIRELLDVAQAQRTKFHVVFDNEVTSLHNLSCSLISFNDSRIRLELTSLKVAGSRWISEPLTCYFKVVEKGPKPREIFHSFRSVVTDTGQSEHESVLLDIKIPEFVGQDQRRKSLRIAPDMTNFEVLNVWPFDSSGSFDPASPKLALADFKIAKARLVNMSAGGMKLTVKNAMLHEVDPSFAKGTRLLMHVKVSAAPGSAMDECWLIAKASNVYEDFVTKDVHIGLEFIGQGRTDEESQKVVWKKVVDNVIEDIAAWTHHWHLELYREKGLGPI
jgi:hypothetical protein